MADWGHPGGGIACLPWDPAQKGDPATCFSKLAVPHVLELLTQYGPVGELRFDADGTPNPTPDQKKT
jgi:hypothetical protein